MLVIYSISAPLLPSEVYISTLVVKLATLSGIALRLHPPVIPPVGGDISAPCYVRLPNSTRYSNHRTRWSELHLSHCVAVSRIPTLRASTVSSLELQDTSVFSCLHGTKTVFGSASSVNQLKLKIHRNNVSNFSWYLAENTLILHYEA